MYDKGIGWVGDVLDKVSLRIVVVLSHENLSAYDDFVIVMFVILYCLAIGKCYSFSYGTI